MKARKASVWEVDPDLVPSFHSPGFAALPEPGYKTSLLRDNSG
jgi:hypothetical protein